MRTVKTRTANSGQTRQYIRHANATGPCRKHDTGLRTCHSTVMKRRGMTSRLMPHLHGTFRGSSLGWRRSHRSGRGIGTGFRSHRCRFRRSGSRVDRLFTTDHGQTKTTHRSQRKQILHGIISSSGSQPTRHPSGMTFRPEIRSINERNIVTRLETRLLRIYSPQKVFLSHYVSSSRRLPGPAPVSWIVSAGRKQSSLLKCPALTQWEVPFRNAACQSEEPPLAGTREITSVLPGKKPGEFSVLNTWLQRFADPKS